jgi:hypothetical protein
MTDELMFTRTVELCPEEVTTLVTALDVLLGAYAEDYEDFFQHKYRTEETRAKKAFGLYRKLEGCLFSKP